MESNNSKEDLNYTIARQAINQAKVLALKDLLVAMTFIIQEEQRKLETSHLKPNLE